MTARRARTSSQGTTHSAVAFRVMKFSTDRHEIVLLRFGEWTTSTAANLLDAKGGRITAIRQPNTRFGQPWDEDAFRDETRRFVQEFNARQVIVGARVVTQIVWLMRNLPVGEELVA